MQSPSSVLGSHPSSSPLDDYLQSITSEPLPDPEIKSYPDAVYFNYYALGLSLLFLPIDGYKPKTGLSRAELRDKDLVLDSVDIYNNLPKGQPKTSAGQARQFSPFPALPISIPEPGKPESTLEVAPNTTGKDFVAFLGEPSRKGGGSGPSGGSIGIWCEWKAAGMMVEFGGDDSKSWDRGKDAMWSVLTLFRVDNSVGTSAK
ncbi:hypothetical protein FRC04_003059 [Tulasnella sp. 424]|nr:hypothetical protein FRC04_003059 [Tulasnella sp. 424]KAG8981149.1 hypothetical protein FRC05_004050 [Tulasnella sp. 425]